MTGGGTRTGSGVGAMRLLRDNRPFRALWCARSISFLGDSLGLVTLLLYVADTNGQALAVAPRLLVGDFAPALLGPFTGVLSDRFDLKRVMVLCDLAQGLLVALIALTLPSLPLLLALVGLRAVAGHVFQPASRAAVPSLVRDRDLEGANSAIGFGTNGSEALGPLLAAALLPVLGAQGVLLVDAATFLVSAALLVSLPSMLPAPTEEGARSSFLLEARAGLGYIRSVPLVRTIGLGFFAVVAFNGIDDVALVFLARDSWTVGIPRRASCTRRWTSGCWWAMRCCPATPDASRWSSCSSWASERTAPATSSAASPGPWSPPSPCRSCVAWASLPWTSPPTPSYSARCLRRCWGASSATSTARSGSRPGSPMCSGGSC
jgi:MFS family permease